LLLPRSRKSLFDLPDESKELFALAKAHSLGLLNAWVPESAGGLGLGPSRTLCWVRRSVTETQAATADEGLRNTYFASRAKLMASDACMRITTDAVQVFGG